MNLFFESAYETYLRCFNTCANQITTLNYIKYICTGSINVFKLINWHVSYYFCSFFYLFVLYTK